MKKRTHANATWSITRRSVAFLVVLIVLFPLIPAGILLPRIDSAFENLSNKVDQAVARAYAGRLHQYLEDRELMLNSIARSEVLLDFFAKEKDKNTDEVEYIKQISLLGEDPELTLMDIEGNILYSETNNTNIYAHVLPQLKNDGAKLIRISNDQAESQFEFAVLIRRGEQAVGVLIAHLKANPQIIFSNDMALMKNETISFHKEGRTVSGDSNSLLIPHSETVTLPKSGLIVTYTVDHRPFLKNSQSIILGFILTIFIASLALLIILFLIASKIIYRPFKEFLSTQEAIASAVEGISRIDTQGHYITLNAAYANAAGYEPEELVGKPWFQTVFEDDLPMLNDAYETMLKEGKVTAEARGLKKDGSIFYKQVTMISQYDKAGEFIGHHCFLKDITSTKETEEKIRRHEKDLKLIFDNVPVKIWYKDDKNRILRLNKKAAESMGGKVEDFEGKDTYDLFPEMAKKYHEDDLVVIRSNKPNLGIVEEYTPLNAPKSWVSTDKIPYVDEETNERFVFVCSQDITALKNAELEQNKLIDRITYSNKELEQFAYIASHDLKSPLRGIEQLSNWIVEDCGELIPEESKKHLQLMVSRVKRMANLLDDLLDYSLAGRIDLTEENVNLSEVMNNMLDLHVRPSGFDYDLDIPDSEISIARKPLEIVIRNLLDNAVKHNDKDKGKVWIRYQYMDNAHMIEVEDNGPGIDPLLREKAFEMFKTLKTRDQSEGSGMGLAIIKKILDRYSGSIVVDCAKSESLILDSENSKNSDSATLGSRGTVFKIVWPSQNKDTNV